MSTTNNITLLIGTRDNRTNQALITRESLENMLGRDYIDNDNVEVRAYLKLVLASLAFNK